MMTKIIGWIMGLSILAACSTNSSTTNTPTPEQLATEKGYSLGESVKRVMNYNLDGWNYINKKALIIHSTPRKDYLITLRENCYDLSSSEVIATTSTANALQADFDAIIVRQAGTSLSRNLDNPRKCYIDKIYVIIKKIKDTDAK
jgi:Family of unknown function (DUF6491)